MGDRKRELEELDKICLEIGAKILDIINESLVGKYPSGDAIYIASSTLAHCAAIVLVSQMPKTGNSERLLEGFIALFKSDAEAILELRRSGKPEGENGDNSAWG